MANHCYELSDLNSGESEDMIKFVMCCTRHPDMTREQFQDY
jgi:hypothetical protein